MKVVQINTVFGYGSTGRNCLELEEYLRSKGEECTTIYSKGKLLKTEYVVSSLFERKLTAFMARLSGLFGYHALFSTRKTISILNDEKPDIVCINNVHSNYINFPKLLKYLGSNDISTVLVLHDCWLYTGYCTHYSYNKCDKWRDGCHECAFSNGVQGSWLFNRTNRMWNDKCRGYANINNLSVVGVSDWITNEARESPMFKNARVIETINNWVDQGIFKPVGSITRQSDKFCILIEATKWDDIRNRVLIRNLLRHYEQQVHFVVVGETKWKIINTNITFFPYITQPEKMAEIMRSVDCYFHMSYEDSFGKIVVESLSCGTPVIVFNRTALPSLIDERCGCVVSPQDESQIEAAIDRLLKLGKQSFSSYCVEMATKRYNKNAQCGKYHELFQQITGEM